MECMGWKLMKWHMPWPIMFYFSPNVIWHNFVNGCVRKFLLMHYCIPFFPSPSIPFTILSISHSIHHSFRLPFHSPFFPPPSIPFTILSVSHSIHHSFHLPFHSIYGTIRDHIQEFYKGEMKKSLNLLINLADHIQE